MAEVHGIRLYIVRILEIGKIRTGVLLLIDSDSVVIVNHTGSISLMLIPVAGWVPILDTVILYKTRDHKATLPPLRVGHCLEIESLELSGQIHTLPERIVLPVHVVGHVLVMVAEYPQVIKMVLFW